MHRTPVRTISGIGIACVAAIVLLTAGGCNKPASAPSPATATQPTTAASRPTTMPASAVFSVNGHPITFDAPRATLDRRGGTTRLLIYSDKENDAGSFYFEMPIEGDVLSDAPQEWEMRTPQKQREDTLIGIESPDRVLQPAELAITAQAAGEGLVQVKLHGRFLVYAPDSDDPVSQATVEAEFAAGLVGSRGASPQ